MAVDTFIRKGTIANGCTFSRGKKCLFLTVAIATSNSFLIPTHQVNALYMGPGEYRTRDYIKIGGPLAILYIAILVAMTYFLYL